MTDYVPTAAAVLELVHDYRLHGFAISHPGVVPDEMTDPLMRTCLRKARTLDDNRGDRRMSINDKRNIEDNSWWKLLNWAIEPLSPIRAVMDTLHGDCWWYDVCGGDVVDAFSGHTHGPCCPHSDWQGCADGVMAVSILVQDLTADMAPLIIYSKHTGKKTVCVGLKGTLLFRDVDAIHHGSVNTSDKARVLPCIRFVSARALRSGYRPTQFVPQKQALRFSLALKDKCVFIIEDDRKPEDDDDDDAPAQRRFITPVGTVPDMLEDSSTPTE